MLKHDVAPSMRVLIEPRFPQVFHCDTVMILKAVTAGCRWYNIIVAMGYQFPDIYRLSVSDVSTAMRAKTLPAR